MKLPAMLLLPFLTMLSNPDARGDDRPSATDDRVQNFQRIKDQEMASLNQKLHLALGQYDKKLSGALTSAQKSGDTKEFALIKAEEDQISTAMKSSTATALDASANPPTGSLLKSARADFDRAQTSLFTAAAKKIADAKKKCVKDLKDRALLAFKAGKNDENTRLTKLADDLENDQSDIPQPPLAAANNQPNLEDVLLPDSLWQGRITWDKIPGDAARDWYCNLTVTQQGNGTFTGRMNMGDDGHNPWNLIVQGTYRNGTLTFNNSKSGNLAMTLTGTLKADNELDLKWTGPDGHNRARTGTATLALKKPGNAGKVAAAAR